MTGANGQLGNEMRIVTCGSQDHYFFSDVTDLSGIETIKLDVTNREEVMAFVHNNHVKMVVNCAAYTNVDKAENDYDLAELLNATAVRYLSEAMKAVDGFLIHISTDYVFGGDPYNTPCIEDQKGTPTGVYGLTKLHGEQVIIGSGCKYIIIRTAWLYSEFGKNFVKTMLNLIVTKPQLKVVFDQVGTPTYAYDLAAAIFDIIEHRKYEEKSGVYHYSNEGVCSWYDFTKMIQQIAVELESPSATNTVGAHGACEVLPCHSNEFFSPVKRPAFSVLDKTKFKKSFGIVVPYWVESLRICLKVLLRKE